MLIGYFLSSNRRKISLRTVLGGLGIQIVIAILVLKVPAVQSLIEFVGKMFILVFKHANHPQVPVEE